MFDWIPAYERFLIDMTLIQVLLVLSLVVLLQCGLFSLATAGFAAIGAYTSALLVLDLGWPVPLGFVAAMCSSVVLAAVFGLVVLRLRGIYLALGSLALAQIVVVGISNVGFTNGVFGLSGIPVRATTAWLVSIVIAVCVVFQLVHRSHIGRAMRAIRLDERTAAGLGINVFRYRLATFVAGGALAGLAGALEAHRTGVISPGQYSFATLVVVFTYALIGGVGHWSGAVAATIAFRYLEQRLHVVGYEWESFVYGAILVVVVVVAPNGLTSRSTYSGLLARWPRRNGVET